MCFLGLLFLSIGCLMLVAVTAQAFHWCSDVCVGDASHNLAKVVFGIFCLNSYLVVFIKTEFVLTNHLLLHAAI